MTERRESYRWTDQQKAADKLHAAMNKLRAVVKHPTVGRELVRVDRAPHHPSIVFLQDTETWLTVAVDAKTGEYLGGGFTIADPVVRKGAVARVLAAWEREFPMAL